ncbi:serine hydrolase [Defluviimonas aestuarii]|uniref:serine hydrolase domain-containing protein n=1 Tax=Albidovulum aestuarii TaxID=1130726 RepID=UPI00249A8128|nr:serine hydrolase [Defluviimonas aestuarii]MDI3337530.1 serine hydrolase [Defluviimonas aestuarii]
MRKFLRIAGKIAALVLVVALAVAIWKREEITRLMAVNSLFTAEKITRNFSHMNELFLTRPLSRGDGPVSPLPEGPTMKLPEGTAKWIEDRAVTALLVLKGGRIVHESYYRGTGAGDLRISWSMAKSFLSVLFGTVLEEGAIASLDDPVLRYVPVLKDTAYDGTTIRQVLNMTTGVKFDEDYLDFHSDINRMGRVLALGGSMDEFAASLREREAEPGSRWEYVSIDTHVLGMIIAGATGRDPADLMDERIIRPMGFEAEPYFLTDGDGTAFVLGGLNMRTRDYARFGQMILQGGEWQGRRIVAGDWIAASIRPSAPNGALYGYQWWIPEDAWGDVMARGIYGQYIYISPRHDTVIVVNAADRNFREDEVEAENEAMFKAIAASR